MNKHKKWRCISMMTMTGVATVIPIFSIGCSRAATYQVAAENKLVPLTNEEIVQLMHKDIAIDQNLIGMEYNPTKYDALIKEQIDNIKRDEDDKYITYNNEFLDVKFNKEYLKSFYFNDNDFLEDIAKSVFQISDMSSTALYYKYYYGQNIKIYFDEGPYALKSIASAALDYNGWRENFVESSIGFYDLKRLNDMKATKEEIISYTCNILSHEWGHFNSFFMVNSKSNIFKEGYLDRFRESHDSTTWYNLYQLAGIPEAYGNVFAFLKNWGEEITTLEKEEFLKMMSNYLKDYYPNLFNYKSELPNKFIEDFKNEFNYFHFNDSRFIKDFMVYYEWPVWLMNGYKTLSTMGFLDVKNFTMQMSAAFALKINPYPYDVQFPKRFMAAWYKSIYGIGDMNTIYIDDMRKNIWFAANSTELEKVIGKIKVVYDDEEFELNIENKDFAIGFNSQPLAFERTYKYINKAAYAFKTYQHPHSSKPQHIIFYDKENNVIEPTNTQLTIKSDYISRYVYNIATKNWVENYDTKEMQALL